MKQQEEMLSPNQEDNDMELEFNTIDQDMTENMVENFARQIDEVVRIQDDSQSDEEEQEDHFGYQQLPQDEEGDDMYQQLQSDDEEENTQEENINSLDIELDPSARLNPETSDLIKSIMTNIQLSKDAVPDWAKKIPESAWLPRVKD